MPFLAPVVTSIGGILTGASAFLSSGTILAGVARLGLGIAAQYAVGALIGTPSAPSQVTHLQAQYGENLPRTVVLGKRGLAGHFIYRNAYETGNRRIQDVYVLSHFRINGVTRVRYEGAWKTLGGVEDPERGFRVQDIDAEIWIKVYKGALDQAADPNLIEESNPPGRWTAAHRLAGLAYAVVTQQLDREKLPNPWDAFFEVEGVCYDWRQDDSVGGDGEQRWSDPATWGPSVNPVIQAYNLERGFYLGDQLIVGKGIAASRLPLANWTLAANIADEAMVSGPRYTSSYIASAGQGITHANNMEPILAACAGSWYNGPAGEYPIAGANQAVVATITDADLLVDEDERISLKRTRSELVNTIAGTYYDPTTFYEPLPLATRTDADAFAADRERLAASIGYEAVTDPAVGDRLNDIALRASRYQGNAEICLRPKFLGLKVGQWIRWQSDKADGFDKSFQILRRRLGPLGPKACRAVYLTLQEVGEGIFDPTAYQTLPPDSVVPGAPDYQSELVNFQVNGILGEATTGSKRAAIRATWNALEDITITGIDLEYGPIAATGQVPATTITKSASFDQTLVDMYEGVMSSSLWAARYKLRSSPPRTFFPSTWFEVDTLDARLGDSDVYLPGMVDQINQATADQLAPLNVNIRDVIEDARRVAREASNQDAGQFLDRMSSLTQVKSVYGQITADYQLLVTAATGPGSALVQRLETLEATIPGLATVSALNVVQLNVDTLGTTVTAQGVSISGLNATVGNFSASSLFRTAVVATEAGALSTVGISVAATAGGATSQAALLLSALAGGDSMLGLVASKVYITDGANSENPFVFSGGVARLNVANIGTVTAGILQSTDGKVVFNLANKTLIFSE
ncbi:phage tail protein [Mesorhizobium sp. BR1-1-12]|uniref:phage tail protein n=1 Tax=unclassified Mesorhizobium TaxID=325217 RepID=UPI001CC9F918|nr:MULTISPECIES: phage tail protein [unclassified Mesorhizobium]MBZ9919102.1 phage tail protein [Mesorhizobium sp. BR1-1-7]MBZ9970119.1 phage tail protein [Mesorhizobium sp. BR1-1-12]